MRVACASTVACIVTTYAFATSQSVIATNVFPIISETFTGTPQSAVSEFALGFASWVLFFMVAVVKSLLAIDTRRATRGGARTGEGARAWGTRRRYAWR